jgi:predicted DCC family thiol-disulfide oxidoreductase YuxK
MSPQGTCPDRLAHSEPPSERALLLYDGECYFCLRWIRRWQDTLHDKVDVAPFQSLVSRFDKDIPVECFQSAIRLITTDGKIYGGPEAVFRAWNEGCGIASRIALWCYQFIPGFAPLSQLAYRIVARHRELASHVTTLFWGRGEYAVCRPTFYNARRWFLRLIGIVYLIAFVSYWTQVDGLTGRNGILPSAPWLEAIRDQFGSDSYRLFPTLCWLNSSDWFLHFLCAGGVLLSLLLVAEIVPALCLLLLWAFYLSLSVSGQIFMNFQWDYLLLEAGFLSIFLAPLRLLPSFHHETRISPLAHFLLCWLLFRLMLMSGVVKLTSGDESWWNLTALRYHYETQPLPTPAGWLMHQCPGWFQAASIVLMFAVEIGAPFLLFAPRRLRLTGVIALITLQLLIALSGNYCFFTLLTIGLCLLFIDDYAWPPFRKQLTIKRGGIRWPGWFMVPLTVFVLICSGPLLWDAFLPGTGWPRGLDTVYAYVEPFRSLNGYGLFRVMTKTRPEIIVEGSQNGVTWRPYEFKYKAGDVNRAPPIVAPHQPRLDWQMWFAALDDVRGEPWFVNFLARLLQGSRPVLQLLKENPFGESPPRYVRARLFQYHFTDLREKRETGAWWKRGDEEIYCPEASLRQEEQP